MAAQWHSSGKGVVIPDNWQSICTLAFDWQTPYLANPENPAEIEASHWSRAQNAGFSLVERSVRKFLKGVPLQSWTCANRGFLTSNGTWLVHLKCFNRSLASIEASGRLNDPEMNLDWLSICFELDLNWFISDICTDSVLVLHWHWIGSSKFVLIGHLPL